jgi:hypothetical protein
MSLVLSSAHRHHRTSVLASTHAESAPSVVIHFSLLAVSFFHLFHRASICFPSFFLCPPRQASAVAVALAVASAAVIAVVGAAHAVEHAAVVVAATVAVVAVAVVVEAPRVVEDAAA